jgi:hypothetical protein
VKSAVEDFMTLLHDVNDQHESNVVDFMAICSSCLLLSNARLEEKIDVLFSWIGNLA